MRAHFRAWFVAMVATDCSATTAPRDPTHRLATGWGCGENGPPLLSRLAALALERCTVTSAKGRSHYT
jgi:hypothetical protein